MCLPWNHKWETIDRTVIGTYDDTDDSRPVRQRAVISQRCTHCGKEIVRKYRV